MESFEELVNLPDVDIVVIASPSDLHADQILVAMDAGKHILAEKPVVTTPEDCRRVVEAAGKSDRKIQVGQICRFSPYFNVAKDLHADGKLGDPSWVEGTYIHRVVPPLKSWWADSAPGSLATLGGGSHPLDLMRWIVGEVDEVISASASNQILGHVGVCDCVTADLRFEAGCLGRLFVTMGAVRPYSIDITIYGTRGTVMNDKVFFESYPVERGFETIPVEYKEEHPYFPEEQADLIDAIENDRDPLVTLKDGARTAMACLAVVEAIQTGGKVEVERL